MEYQEFLQTIKENVRKEVPIGCNVELNTVIKNNDQKLDAIIISEEDSQIALNIYLNRYYEELSNGRKLDSIIKEIVGSFYANRGKEFKTMPNVLDFNSISKQITYRLINLEMNRERLTYLPHQVIEDMAKIYYIIVKSDSDSIGSIAITYDLMSGWRVDEETIDNLANKNTPDLFPAIIKSMDEIIMEIFNNEVGKLNNLCISDNENIYNKIQPSKQNTAENLYNHGMYVLSNSKGINGANTILYPDLLHEFSEKIQSNLYILPSSVHEVIVVPTIKRLSRTALREMVIDVNNSQVPVDEILSNEVYYYDAQSDELHIAKEI